MITIRETYRSLVQVPEFSLQQLGQLGNVAIASEESRISQAINIHDQPAKPLSSRYAAKKVRAGGQPVRDLHLTGEMLGDLREIDIEEKSVMVGFSSPLQEAKAQKNERIENMLGISPANKFRLDQEVRDILAQNIRTLNGK